MAAPLFVTRDEALLDELLRLAAAAGTTPVVAHDAVAGLRSWVAAPLVVVGLDLAPALVSLAPPRRPDVSLVCWADPPAEAFRHALELGASEVVELPDHHHWLGEALADLDDPRGARGLTLGVIGGSGGAGASVLACSLGQVAADTGPALVVDTDPLGPGLDRVLGVEDKPGIRWGDLQQSAGRLGARALREALPGRGDLGVLTWESGLAEPVPPRVAREALVAGQRGHDVVVLDLPRSSEAPLDELVSRLDLLVVVAIATVLGVAAAARVCARHQQVVQLVVVRGGGVALSEVAAVTGVAAVTSMPAQRRLDEAVDLGLGPVRSSRGPLRRVATSVLRSAESSGARR